MNGHWQDAEKALARRDAPFLHRSRLVKILNGDPTLGGAEVLHRRTCARGYASGFDSAAA